MTPQPPKRLVAVLSSSGQTAPYEEARVAESIRAAAAAAGIEDDHLARDLAAAVTHYLERYHDRPVVTTAEIRRIVEQVLRDTGHPQIADVFLSRSESPRPAQTSLFPGGPMVVEVYSRGEVRPWNRERLRTSLAREAGLDDAAAGEVAAAVEAAILSRNRARISTSEILDLVRQELVRRGWDRRAQTHVVVGMAKHDLARLMAAEPAAPRRLPDPDALLRRIGEETLRQYALQEVFSPAAVSAHLEGAIHIHHVEQPLKVDRVEASGPALQDWIAAQEGASANPAHARRRILGLMHRSGTIARALRIGGWKAVESLLPPAEIDELAADLREILPTPSSDLWNVHLDLAADGVETIAAFLNAFAASDRIQWSFQVAARVFREPDRRALLARAARRALESGASFLLGEHRAPPLAAGGWGTRAQVVAINLPRAFWRAPSDGPFFAELERTLEAAVQAHLDKRRFLERFANPEGAFALDHGWGGPAGAWLRTSTFRYAVATCGLGTAATWLAGPSGGPREIQRAAFRIASFVYSYLVQASAQHGLWLSWEDLPCPAASARFARLDGHAFPEARATGPQAYAAGATLPLPGSGIMERIHAESRLHPFLLHAAVRIAPSDSSVASADDLASLILRAHAEARAAGIAIAAQ